MQLLSIGLNTGTAPLALRERLAFSHETLEPALIAFRTLITDGEAGIAEGVIVSTCHRLECYAVVEDADAGREALIRFLSATRGVPATEFTAHLTTRCEQAV